MCRRLCPHPRYDEAQRLQAELEAQVAEAEKLADLLGLSVEERKEAASSGGFGAGVAGQQAVLWPLPLSWGAKAANNLHHQQPVMQTSSSAAATGPRDAFSVLGPVVSRAAGLLGTQVSDVPDLDDFLQPAVHQAVQQKQHRSIDGRGGVSESTQQGGVRPSESSTALAADGSAWRGNALFADDESLGPGKQSGVGDPDFSLPVWTTREPTRA